MNEQEHAAYWRGYNDAKEAIQSGQLRTWVGLTRDEILEARWHNKSSYKFARVLEAILKEKNT